jgi:ribose-phosphate pyrophosphokinase
VALTLTETLMTTMALTSAPLRRLFGRLDFAPRPHDPELAGVLDCWLRLRAGQVAPQVPFPGKGLGPEVSVFVRAPRARDYVLEIRGAELSRLLGDLQQGMMLSAAPKRRQAVRLRRLLEVVVQNGEPVLATFACEDTDDDKAIVDLIAAPVAGSDGRVNGALIACQTRHQLSAEWRPPRSATAQTRPVLFSVGGSQALATDVAKRLGFSITPHEERDFEDGEHKIRPLASVRNQDVYVIANLASSWAESVNDKLCKLMFFIGSLKQSAAHRVTLVAPYLCYSRKERQTKARDPVVTRYLAQVLEAVGVDCVVTVTAHDLAAFQNAFRCRTEHLDTHSLFARALVGRLSGRRVAVVSPDPGGEKRAELFRQTLERALSEPVGKALIDKTRSMGKVTGEMYAGDVEGRTAIVLDDMISTGGTMARAAAACRAHGAAEVLGVATHGLFLDGGKAVLSGEALDEIWVTDSLPLPAPLVDVVARERVRLVPIGSLLGGAIERCHAGGSINDLLEHESNA